MPAFQFSLDEETTYKVMEKLIKEGKEPSISRLAKQLVIRYLDLPALPEEQENQTTTNTLEGEGNEDQ